MTYEPRSSYPQNSSYKPNNNYGSKPKPSFKKEPPKKKEPVKITRTSMVQDMFLDSIKTQEKAVIIRTTTGDTHEGLINHYDLYIIVLGPTSAPTVIYKSAIESIKIVGEIK